MSPRRALSVILLAALASGCDAGRGGRDPTTPSGFEVPRYVSLRYDTVNARSGPSEEHRTLWVYHAKGLPVQIVAETEQWRRICDPEGALSWVHMRLIDGGRTVIRTAPDAVVVRRAPNATSSQIATLAARVVAPLDDCKDGWCAIEIGKTRGWIPASEVWGADPAPQCRAPAR